MRYEKRIESSLIRPRVPALYRCDIHRRKGRTSSTAFRKQAQLDHEELVGAPPVDVTGARNGRPGHSRLVLRADGYSALRRFESLKIESVPHGDRAGELRLFWQRL